MSAEEADPFEGREPLASAYDREDGEKVADIYNEEQVRAFEAAGWCRVERAQKEEQSEQ